MQIFLPLVIGKYGFPQIFMFFIAQNDATYIRELKRTPSAIFETMIEAKTKKKWPKLFRVAHDFQVFALTLYYLLVSAYGFWRRNVNKKIQNCAL